MTFRMVSARFTVAVTALIAVCVAVSLPRQAQAEEESAPPAASAADREALRIHLMDGSQVGGKLGNQEIEVETSYGKLTIPVASVVSLTPGLASHPQIGANISELIEKLGSSAFSEREAAQKALLAMGPSIRAQVARSAEDADTERRTRVRSILEEFDQAEEDSDNDDEDNGSSPLIERDTIETTDFTVVGKVVPQEFTIVSHYGVLNVKLNDIRRIERAILDNQGQHKTIVVDGSSIIGRNMKEPMKDTHIKVERGDKISITADGTITLAPLGNHAVSTPDGVPNFGFFQQNRIAVGTLVGRIGPNGPVFRVGAKSTFTADRPGNLMLAVAFHADPNNQVFPGEYRTKIRVKKK